MRAAVAGLEIPEAGDLDLRALLELAGDDPLVVKQGLDRPARVGLGILVRMASAAVSSALFTASSL